MSHKLPLKNETKIIEGAKSFYFSIKKDERFFIVLFNLKAFLYTRLG